MTEREPLIEVIFDRLAADDVPSTTADVVLAALSGADDLDAALAGEAVSLSSAHNDGGGSREHIYLSSVAVAGFRGVGPERKLQLDPRPGLTLVVGRNGSGKSSFAEAVELSLTGDSVRWAEKNSVWRSGWRNLHTPEPCAITTGLTVDGVAAGTSVRRSWAPGARLGEADVLVTTPAGRFRDLADLGLSRSLSLYRPFLTAADLSKLIAGTPSEIFDALGTILGLDGLSAAEQRLGTALRAQEQTIKGVRAAAADLRTRLAQVSDDRAERAAALLAGPKPAPEELDLLDAILSEPLDSGIDATTKACQRLAGLNVDDLASVQALATELRQVAAAAGGRDADVSRISLRVADLLRLGLAHHADVGDGPCPICRTGTLDEGWRRSAAESLNAMEAANRAAIEGRQRLSGLIRRATALGDVDIPGDVDEIDLSTLRAAVARLRVMPATADALADHLVATYPPVVEAVAAARAAALTWLRQRDGEWRQIAGELHGWLASARQVPECERKAVLLKVARAWLKASGEKIRNERLAPFAEHSQRIWKELRQESNVEIGAMTLVGANTRRHVEFPVSVDGVDNGTALGVMSQGEMHALGLATFLPRSCAPESPFRFVVIDDPVQSMDPAKVDGLAQVLADIAEERQVVVFTHDGRLPDAIRRLEIDARVMEIVRAEQSVVTIRPCGDPVARYLDDASAVAQSTDIDEIVRQPVVAAMCRSAIEAACHDAIWRTRLARGDRHTAIEDTIDAAGKRTLTLASLALFDDASRAGEVMGYLNRRHGRRYADALKTCREGVHGEYAGNLPLLVSDVRALTAVLR